jgi:hypothetical protein
MCSGQLLKLYLVRHLKKGGGGGGGGGADAHFSANIRHAKTSLIAFHGVHDLAISKFCLSHVEPLPLVKILLLTPVVLQYEYN